jgi:hypothetical protein
VSEVTYVNANMNNIISAGLRIRWSSSDVVCFKFSGGENYKDSIVTAGLALVACSNKILLHALKIQRTGFSTFLTRASDFSVEMERESARNMKKKNKRENSFKKKKKKSLFLQYSLEVVVTSLLKVRLRIFFRFATRN